ncbi:MAG: hypothetical protein RKE49_06010 [Oceanicaulis sp.]
MTTNKAERKAIPGAREALLEDGNVRKGHENAKAAREAAELIAFWRDHDRLSGEAVTNAELARRLKVSPQRITNLLSARSDTRASNQGPSYGFLRRVCTAMGYEWPFGLFEAYVAVRGGPAELSETHASVGLVRAAPASKRGDYQVEIVTGDTMTLSGTLSEQNG